MDVPGNPEAEANNRDHAIQILESTEVDNAETIIKNINDCLVPKLIVNYDELEYHTEIHNRNNSLEEKLSILIDKLEKYDFISDDTSTESDRANTILIISSLINLYKELQCNCSWNTDSSRAGAIRLDDWFYEKYNIKLDEILKTNELCDSQAVYDKSLDELCKKLTPEDFKKYPGQVEVYCDLVKNIEEFDVTVNPLKILPVALILTDDYIESNKLQGLQCCHVLLENLAGEDFEDGNYYDVIYLSIKNALNEKDINITEVSQCCALELCKLFPLEIKDEKLDEMYTVALEQINTESNLYRKAAFFVYAKELMQYLGIDCVAKSVFKSIICDTIESCLIDSVAEILLIPTLECLEEWIRYCWPTWKLSLDFKVLCALLKYYSKGKTGEGALLTQKLIVTLVSLCSPEEQKQFALQLGGKDEDVNVLMNGLKKDMGVDINAE